MMRILKGIFLVGILYIFTTNTLQAEEVTVKDENKSGENMVLFHDDFSDPQKSKELWELLAPSQCIIEDGVLRLSLLNNGGGIGPAVEDHTGWGDYVFSAKVRFVEKGKGISRAGFWLRGTSGANIMIVEVDGISSFAYFITDVITATTAGLDQELIKKPYTDGKWHYYRFICKVYAINIWVDGQELGTIKQVPLKGDINIYAGNCIVEFDDVLVMKIKK